MTRYQAAFDGFFVTKSDRWQIALDAVKEQFEINDLLTEQVKFFKQEVPV